MRVIALVSTVVFAFAVAPRSARACSPPACQPTSFVPQSVDDASATLPVNGAVVAYRAGSVIGGGTEETFVARRTRGGTSEVVAVTPSALIELPDPRVGDVWTFETSLPCGGTAPRMTSTTITLTEEADAPTEIADVDVGELEHGPMQLAVSTGECSDAVETAYVDVTVNVAADLAPWRDALTLWLEVDGERFGYSTSLAGGGPAPHLRVFVPCEDREGLSVTRLSEGDHEVRVLGELPGGESIASEPFHVELRCAAAAVDAGVVSGSDAGVVSGADAGTVASSNAGGCAASGGASSSTSALVVALAALLASRRRRG